VLMLSVSQRAEHHSLLGGHRQRNLAAHPDARNHRTPPSPAVGESRGDRSTDRH
jgi:hypothetical protein